MYEQFIMLLCFRSRNMVLIRFQEVVTIDKHLKTGVFRTVLTMSIDIMFFKRSGSLFHILGAAILKDLSPYLLHDGGGTTN